MISFLCVGEAMNLLDLPLVHEWEVTYWNMRILKQLHYYKPYSIVDNSMENMGFPFNQAPLLFLLQVMIYFIGYIQFYDQEDKIVLRLLSGLTPSLTAWA